MIRIPLLFFLTCVVGEENGSPIIRELLPHNPAIASGLKINDTIVQIDDKKVEGLNLKQVVELIQGPAGTAVKISVKQEGESSPLVFSVTRGPVQIPVNQTDPPPTPTSPIMPPSGQ